MDWESIDWCGEVLGEEGDSWKSSAEHHPVCPQSFAALHLLELESCPQKVSWRQEEEAFSTVDAGTLKESTDVAGTGLEVRLGPVAGDCGQGANLLRSGQYEDFAWSRRRKSRGKRSISWTRFFLARRRRGGLTGALLAPGQKVGRPP